VTLQYNASLTRSMPRKWPLLCATAPLQEQVINKPPSGGSSRMAALFSMRYLSIYSRQAAECPMCTSICKVQTELDMPDTVLLHL
jgi:hypothetical protein